jgi:hypothetical protein
MTISHNTFYSPLVSRNLDASKNPPAQLSVVDRVGHRVLAEDIY